MLESGAREVRVLRRADVRRHGARAVLPKPAPAGVQKRELRARPKASSSRQTAAGPRPPFHVAALREAQTTAPAPRLFSLGRRGPLRAEAGPSILERISVGASTQRSYVQRIDEFRDFVRVNGLTLDSAEEVETAILAHMNEMFLEGLAAHHGEKLVAALQWRHPELGRRGDVSMPRVSQALQGWRRGAPSAQRLPMAWVEACGLAAHMADRGSVIEGVMR